MCDEKVTDTFFLLELQEKIKTSKKVMTKTINGFLNFMCIHQLIKNGSFKLKIKITKTYRETGN